MTGRYAFLEMCHSWGLSPTVVEALPPVARREMTIFWRWKNDREAMLRDLAAARAKEKRV